jgi:branched-chain amino acid transport system permease protein
MNTWRTRIIFIVTALVGVGAVAIMRGTLNEYALSVICFVGIYMILSLSLTVTNGFTGLFSLGHPAFMAIGGYITAILTMPVVKKSMFLPDVPAWLGTLEISFLPALIIAGLAAAITALVIGVPVLRLKGHYLAVATLGFLIIVQVLIRNMDTYTRGPLGLNGLEAYTNLWWVYGWVVVTFFVTWKIKFSSLGRSMQAMREDETAAHCSGVNLFRTRVLALMIGAFFAGVSGGLWAHLVTAITPGSFSIVLAFVIVVMVVVGGTGSVTGSICAALVISLITEVFRPLEESLDVYGLGEIAMSLILLSVLIFRPKGLLGSREPEWLIGNNKKK